MARWNSANVLQTTAGGRRLWHMSSEGDQFAVKAETALLPTEPCPSLVGKDWQTLFRKKLNIAWLPADQIFFRAVQLPPGDPGEMAAMVELQMEKLSPLPVTHIVWSFYPMPLPAGKKDALQTVLVIIAARSAVEEFLGQLQSAGFQPDRLEAPGLEQLLAAHITGDGVWIFTGDPGDPALAAWWFDGAMQNLTLIALPAGPERGAQLRTQLEQTAWAGELEGWLTGPPKVHLLANRSDAGFWESVFKDWGASLDMIQPMAQKELATLSARRCSGDTRGTNLLPPEFSTRYHQQFVDRLWIRSLMSVVVLYALGVVFYFGMLYVFQIKDDAVKKDLVNMGPGYTNSMRDVEQIRILRDRDALKFAALDCLKAVAENVPESITMDNVYFRHGKLELRGTVVAENQEDVGNFNDALRGAKDQNDVPLFTDVTPQTIMVSGTNGVWSFTCILKGGEKQ
jgi:hypothetical protein